jgi:outer membrane receptor for ferrienterochelin and colicins
MDGMIDRTTGRFANQPPLKNAGYELTLISKLFEKLETNHQLGYINLKMNKNYTFYEIPKWSLNNTLYYSLPKNLKLSYSLNWTDKMPSPDDSGRLFELPDKTLHDLSLSWTSPAKKYKIAITVSNIFDLDFQEEYGYPAPGRNFSLSLEWVVF